MLNELHIENIAVIEKADISFSKGLNILTGETGAGKSIIIDSIGAVLGDRVSRDLVRRGADKGTVTAVFDIDNVKEWLENNEIEADDELIIQRRISAEGKSSCRVCGVPVTAAQLKEISELLVDIHGQNDGRQLMDEKRHMDYLDRFGTDSSLIASFSEEYAKYRAIKKNISKLSMDELEKARLSESLKYQIEELSKADIKIGEKEGLVSRRDLLRNSEKLTEALDQAFACLYAGDDNAVSLASNAEYYTSRASAITPELESTVTAIHDAVFALTDAAETIRDLKNSLDFSPEEYDRLEGRISQLNKLERKYGKDLDELPAYLEECRTKLDEIEYADDMLIKLEKQLESQKNICISAAARLTENRKKAATELEKRIVKELKELNMPSVCFAVEILPLENEQGFDSTGADEIRFIMSANAGEELGRIAKIASGGELSRIMLAMKNVFAENDPVGTMVFDEIDTGVSGIAAQRVGEKLYTVGQGKQVLCVTHLPQIAAMADSHYIIEKQERDGRTFTQVLRLDREGRKKELARLHGGDNITATTLASAEEQLVSAEMFKNL